MVAGPYTSMSVCALRFSRLTSDGTPDYNNSSGAWCATSVGQVQVTPDIVTGPDIAVLDACNQLAVVRKYDDKIRRVNVVIELIARDPRLIELVTELPAITDFGQTIGYIGQLDVSCGGSTPRNGVAVEVWSENWQCTDLYSDWPYERLILPKAFLHLGAETKQAGEVRLRFEGFAQANSNIGDGPAQDLPADLAAASNWAWSVFFDDDLPDCGPAEGGAQSYIAMSALSS